MLEVTIEDSLQNPDDAEEPVWDKAALQRRVRGKEERVLKLVKLFLRDMPIRVEELTGLLNGTDVAKIAEVAHAIKGVSANLGVLRLQSMVSEIEAAARKEEIDDLKTFLPALVDEYRKSEETLKEYAGKD